jgi:ribosome maturation factor RimP
LNLVTGEVDEEGAVDDKRLAGLIRPVAAAAGMDLETVQVTRAGKRRRLVVVVDADGGVSHDGLDSVSREISALLDASNAMGEVPYTLEVTSPGVDRPLTEPKHWRRAARRLVKVKVAGEGTITGRVVAADQDGIALDVDGTRRELGYSALGPGAVQVEFGRLPDDDELAGDELDDDELADDELEEDDLVKDDEAGDKAKHGAGGDGH